MTKTKVSIKQAIADASILNAAEFCEKYDDSLEYLDIDNIMDYNEGYVNLNLNVGNKTVTLLFIDGEYQAD